MHTHLLRSLLLVTALALPAIAAAQPPDTRAIVLSAAPIYIQPGAQVPLRVAKAGTSLRVLQEEGDWAEVEFNDPQFGRRVGWVEKKLIRIARPGLEPMDLSVKEPEVVAEPIRNPESGRPAITASSSTDEGSGPRFSRGWIDVNMGVANAAERSIDTEVNIPDGDGEFERYAVGYRFPQGASFDFGGGVMFTPMFGAGVQFTGTAHQEAADLSIRIPHPLYFNAHAVDSTPTDRKLDRVEGAMNLSLVVAVPTADDVTFRVYGGPTYFRLQADVVNNIRYLHEYGFFTTFNSVEIMSWESEEVEETVWGFHAGVDVGYFFGRHIGIGGFGRATRGTVTFRSADFLLDQDLDVTVGGFQAGVGLRIRF